LSGAVVPKSWWRVRGFRGRDHEKIANIYVKFSWQLLLPLPFWHSHQYLTCIPFPPMRATFPAHLILLPSIILIRYERTSSILHISSSIWLRAPEKQMLSKPVSPILI
jgi:hypothetical protein